MQTYNLMVTALLYHSKKIKRGPWWQSGNTLASHPEAGVRFLAWPQVGKLVVACRWSAVYSTFIYLFGVLRRFQHCTGHITMGSWKGRGNQYIQFVRVLYCKLPTNGKQLPAFPLKALTGSNPRLRGGRRECYHSATVPPPQFTVQNLDQLYVLVSSVLKVT